MDWSHYEYAYESILETYDGSEGALPTDKFSVAIRKLHVSMIPDQLPCRTEEREEVETFIRSAITSGDTGKPMYICGMPGKQQGILVTSAYITGSINAQSFSDCYCYCH
jgi:hypothetical protein